MIHLHNLTKISYTLVSNIQTLAIAAVVMTTPMLASTFSSYAKDSSIKISTKRVKVTKGARAEFVKSAAKANRILKAKSGKSRAPLQITTINVVNGCSASVNCGGDAVIECSIPGGPASCHSNPFSVACIAPGDTHPMTSSCPLPNPFD